jgi:hypothetical protein
MPLKKLVFKAGINRENTSYANEGGWFAGDKIRFRSGQAEKVGGWQRDTGAVSNVIGGVTTVVSTPPTGVLWGVARALWNWITLSSFNLLAVGTNLKYYIQNSPDGSFFDVTPIRKITTAAPNAFTTTSGSRTVRVNDTAHGAKNNDFVTISATSGAVNGIPAAELNAEFQITYLDSNSYYITVPTTSATSSGTSAVTATLTYQISTGSTTAVPGNGWGAGLWGGTITGVASSTLNGAINNSVTSIVLTNAASFTTAGTVVIDSENITYTGKSVNTLTGCTRGVSGSTAAAHSSGAIVQQSDTFTGWGAASTSATGTGVQLRLWSQKNFGQNLVFCPRGGPMYYWATNAIPNIFDRGVEIKAGTTVGGAAVDSTCPSLVNFVLVSDSSRFVIAFGANDPTGVYATLGLDPMQIRWSDQESYSTWTPATTNQAGDFRLSNGSMIVTAIQTRQEILVLTDSAIYSMQYLGPPYVWGVQIMGDNISIAGPNAIATVNNITYWMGQDKFYMYSGRVQTMPSTLREYVFTDINLAQSYQVVAGTNEGYNEVWWQYCSANSTVIDRYVIYNHLDDVWYYGTWNNINGLSQGRTAWLDSPLRGAPMSMTYGTAGSADNALLVYQETGTDDNVTTPALAINSYVTSSDFDMDDGHNYSFLWRAIPDLTFDGSYVNAPSCNLTVYPRNFPGTAYLPAPSPTITSTQNYQNVRTYAVQQFTPQVYTRVRGRQMAFEISSNTLGVQWQMGNMRIDLRQDGRKS